MPFDGRDNTPALNRARLIEALRAEMPAGFTWNFNWEYTETPCGAIGCALGVAQEIGLLPREWELEDAESAFGMTNRQIAEVFYAPENYGVHDDDYDAITPAMVADALERLS